MNKSFFLISFIIFGCNNTSELNKDSHKNSIELKNKDKFFESTKKENLISEIEENLMNKVDIVLFLDSLTKQNNIKIIDTLTETVDEENRILIYNSKKNEFKLKILETDFTSNTLFFDEDKTIDFSKHKLLSNNNEKYKTEDFGFNFRNRLVEAKIIEIAEKQFIYADIIFDCNGKGCGCQLNFIYDIKNKKAFFLDNFRFPYSNYFISDFNNDAIIDLLVIGRNKETIVDGLPIQKLAYQATWFEYRNNEFKMKRNYQTNNPISYEFVSYSQVGEYPETSFSLIINN